MPLPSDIVTITVTATYLDMLGNPRSGAVTFTPQVTGTFADPSDGVFLEPDPAAVTLNSSGAISVVLPCTDNTVLSPTGFAWLVNETIDGSPDNTYSILLPSTLGTSVLLPSLAHVIPPGPVPTLYGVLAGPNTWTGLNTFTHPVLLPGDPVSNLQAAPKQYVDVHSDASYTLSFAAATTVTVPHNLGKYPSVSVLDSALDLVECDVQHVSVNTLVLTFSAAFSGTVACN